MRRVFFLLVLIGGVSSAAAQVQISALLGTDIPLTYNVGVQARFSQRWSAAAQVGLLAAPYDGAIVSIAEAFGMSDTLGRAIKAAFQEGVGVSLSGAYHFGPERRHHVRLLGQYLHLSGGGAAIDLLEASLSRDFNALRAPQPGSPPPLALDLQCDLWLIGAYYGYTLPLGSGGRWALRGEIGLAKVVGSSHAFSSNRPRLDGTALIQSLYSALEQDLTEVFADYGYAPSLNLHVVYTFGSRASQK